MNTPPARKRNYRNTKPSDKAADGWRRLPDGHFSTGICSEPVLIAYARAVSLWPLVEDAMTNVLMELIGTDMRHGELVTVESLDAFRDACNALTRRALLLSFRQ